MVRIIASGVNPIDHKIRTGQAPYATPELSFVFLTVWEGLVDRANVYAGQRVLVQGGSGGVGHVAVQIARAFGAEVFTTASAGKRKLVESLGATAIDCHISKVGRRQEGVAFVR